ncbi:hypothetical protein CO010_01045 [Candidatus Shapirobacteria bacterium CG_4_8_14_3_um_filter_39_11]|uniref:Uncharacterized protein n=1 Tax=Candidatus Shapirobacteria bacterium CG_4_8_14_3_um_filter_39_11 TaxID=1974875 RepID=A0A2M8GI68_9BACT|nr:MAG: hypothetical protein CO010_01045 [Candidatus Shapirobacteria bacterium CG_4_8_14_3_um_filter_39_11]
MLKMGVEHGIKLVTVIFPKTGKTLQAELINAQDIKNGGTYLVDRDHNADIIVKPVSSQPLPEGGWQLKE